MSFSLKQHFTRNLLNIPGWRTNRRIVVIESDDWGSVRMPSIEVYEKFLKAGIRVDKDPYCRYDSLATKDDLEALFEVLSSVMDSTGRRAVLTANSVVALSLIHISEPTRLGMISYAVFCLKKK